MRPHTGAGADRFRAPDVGSSTAPAPFAADWDGDGDLDLLVGNGDGEVKYFERLNDSTVVLRQGAAMDPFHGLDVGDFANPMAADFDGDGDLDLIVGESYGSVKYYERLSNSTLVLREGAAADPFHGLDVGRFSSPCAADWDGDGDLDLIVGNGDGEVKYYERLNDATVVLRQGAATDPFHGLDVGDFANPMAMDFDGDGDLDLIVGEKEGGVKYYERLSSSTLVLRAGAAADPFHALDVGRDSIPCVADWDGDGDLDLFVGNRDSDVKYLERLDDSTLVLRGGATTDPFNVYTLGTSIAPRGADWDGDGDLDLLVGNNEGHVKYFERLNDFTVVLRHGAAMDPFHGLDVGDYAVPSAADFDGDGDLDLIVGNSHGHVKYFERLSNSTLVLREGAAADPFHGLDVGAYAYPCAADWDGDGDLDLLVGNGVGEVKYYERLNDFTVVLRQGAATDPFHGLDVGDYAVPSAADFDGDGDVDLIVGNSYGRVKYFERLSNSTSVPREGAVADPLHALNVGRDASPCAADWDGDGDFDLLVGNAAGEVKYVERPDDSTWVLREGVTTDSFHVFSLGNDAAPCAADWDGDGDLDLLVGNLGGNVKYVERLSNSTLVLHEGAAADPFHALDVGLHAAPCAADWDGDGDLDLLVGNYGGNVKYFERLSNTTLVLREGAAADPFHALDVGLHAAPCAADWDGDGDLDLLVGNLAGHVKYFERLSNTTLVLREGVAADPFHALDVGMRAAPFAADMDGDGDLDLIVGNLAGHVKYFERLSSTTLVLREGVAADPFHALDVGMRAAPFAADWDDDGDLDLLVGNTGHVKYFEHRQDTTLVLRHGAAADPVHALDVGRHAAPFAADWDNDGDFDLLVGSYHGHVKYFERLHDSTLVLRQGAAMDPFHALDVGMKAAPCAADWDGDGDLDLLVGTEFRVKYFERLSNSTLVLRQGAAADPFHHVYADSWAVPFAADWDGDGDLDLIVGSGSGRVFYFERLPDSTLVPREGVAANPFHDLDLLVRAEAAPFAADWDGDGDLDLIVGSGSGKVFYFERLPDSSLVLRNGAEANPFHQFAVGYYPVILSVTDWDGDGDLDMLVGNSDGQMLYFEHGACSPISQCSNRGMCDLISGRCSCLAGYATHDCHACEVGYKRGAGEKDCTECPEGKFSGLGSQACTQCEVNHYSDARSHKCIACPSGKKATIRQHDCTNCPNNTYSDSVNGICKVCPAGYIPTSDGGNCVPCPGGRVPAGDGTCTSCAAGTAASSGDSVCTPCMSGKYAKAAFDDCKPCPSDSIAAAGSDSCEACSLGFVPSAGGSSCGPGVIIVALSILIPAIVLAAAVAWGVRRWRRRTARFAVLAAVQTRNAKKLRKAIKQGTKQSVDKMILHEAQSTLDMCLHKYVDSRFLLKVLDEGDLKLLKGGWLADREEGWRFQRQQDLPEEAFWTAEELEAEQRCVLFVAISYCWLHPVHPDPESKHFRTLRHALRLRLGVKGVGEVEDIALFLDYSSMPQHGEQGDPSEPEPGVKRDEVEQASFGRALKQVNLAYANQLIEVWMMKWVPEEQPRKYMTRGWPFFEQAVAGLITDSSKLLTVEPATQQCRTWSDLFDRSVLGRCPPMTPDEFEQEIRSKTFTNGKTDADFVVHKYAETFDEVVGNAQMLWFTNLKWTDEDVKELVKLLPCCKHVQGLYLGWNNITAEGAMELVKAAKDCPTLLTIDLSRNSIPVSEEAAIRRQWEKSGKSPIKLRLKGARRQSLTRDKPIEVGL